MKYPSIQRLFTELGKVLTRFPLETFFAFAGSCAATALIELRNNNPEYSNWCWRIIMAANLGLLLSLSASLFSNSLTPDFKKKLLLYFSSLLISIAFVFVFDPLRRESDVIRFFMISLGFHLLVSFAAFIGKKNNINAFWQFNKTLFLRFLAGALYSGVLYMGLCAALASMNFLFNFDFESDTFSIMGVWIIGMFQTLFFLAGVPMDIKSLQEDPSYPKGLKLFTQYVLIPLASVYAAILLSYEIKILLQWNMPKGLVSSLILGYAVFGILSFLLIYPLRNQEGHKWIRTYSKSFYFLLVPLLVLLYLAILTRVEKYGITEERYFLIVLAIWLSFITAYFLLSRRQNIMVIPITLSLITIIGVYGPLSAFNIAEQSQLRQLREILIKNKALSNGKLKPLIHKIDSGDNARVRDITKYMVTKYGLESLQPLINVDLSKVRDSIILSLNKKKQIRRRYNKWELNESEQNWLNKNYKLPVHFNYDTTTHKDSYAVSAENEELIPLNSADFMIDLNYYHKDNNPIKLEKNNHLYYSMNDSVVKIRIDNDSVKIDLIPLMNQVHQKVLKTKKTDKKSEINNPHDVAVIEAEPQYLVPRSYLTIQFNLSGYQVGILFNRIQYRISGNKKSILSGNGVMLLRTK